MLAFISEWASILVLIAQGVFAWWWWSMRRSFVGKEKCAEHCAVFERRLIKVEAELEDTPDPVDTSPILVALEQLRGEVKTIGAKVDGQGQIISRLDKGLDRLTDHHLRGDR